MRQKRQNLTQKKRKKKRDKMYLYTVCRRLDPIGTPDPAIKMFLMNPLSSSSLVQFFLLYFPQRFLDVPLPRRRRHFCLKGAYDGSINE